MEGKETNVRPPPSTVVGSEKETNGDEETVVASTDNGDAGEEKSTGEDLTKHHSQLSRIDSADYPSSWRLAMIIVALCLTVFLVALDMTIVSTAIPHITDEFRKSTV